LHQKYLDNLFSSFSNLNIMTLLQKALRVERKFLRNFLTGLLCGWFLMAQAQSPMAVASVDTTAKTKSAKQMSVGLSFGITKGIGIDFTYQLARKLNLKAGFSYADLSKDNYLYTLAPKANDPLGTTPQTFSFDVAAKLSSLNVGIEYALGAKGRFRLLAGIGYYPSNNISAAGELASVVRFKDLELNSKDLGSGSVKMGFSSPIAPYLGIGIGRLVPRKRLNVSLDLGAMYKGDYKFDINVIEGGLLKKANEENAVVLDKNFNASMMNKIWPNANLRIGYRLF
jgi:opacity protein-like surface antigen